MSFFNPMIFGFITMMVVGGIIIILIPSTTSIKIGVMFFWCFCGAVYFIQHIILYFVLHYNQVPSELFNPALRRWTMQEIDEHNQRALQEYVVDNIIYGVESQVQPWYCVCAPAFKSAGGKQFWIGCWKCIICSGLMFVLGKFLISEALRRRRQNAVVAPNPNIEQVQPENVINQNIANQLKNKFESELNIRQNQMKAPIQVTEQETHFPITKNENIKRQYVMQPNILHISEQMRIANFTRVKINPNQVLQIQENHPHLVQQL